MANFANKPYWYIFIRYIASIVKGNIVDLANGKIDASLLNIFKILFKGFRGDKYNLYKLYKGNTRDYISDSFVYCKIAPLIDKNRSVLNYINNKALFYFLTNSYLNVPEILALIIKGKLTPVAKYEWLTDIESLSICLERNNKLIFKPFLDGHGGQGLYIVELTENGFSVNGKIFNSHTMQLLIESLNNYIITRFIYQAKYSRDIYSETSNTIRIYTFYDHIKRYAFIHNALHRFGSKSSYPLDAYSRGGIFTEVDINTGILGAPFTRVRDNVVRLQSHPDTQHTIKGTIVPFWEDITATILRAAPIFDSAIFLGWDILVTDSGFTVLEINVKPCPVFLQILRPALEDPRVVDIVNTL